MALSPKTGKFTGHRKNGETFCLGFRKLADREPISRRIFTTAARNRSKKPWQVNTLRINGVSVDDHLHQSKKDKQYTSIHIDADESSAGYKTLVEMGEPVWYKAEPRVVPPREQTEVVLWLRRPPQDAFKLEITTDAGQQETEVIPMRPACDIEAIDFADGRREIFIYARRWREVAGTVVAILVDGRLAATRQRSSRGCCIPCPCFRAVGTRFFSHDRLCDRLRPDLPHAGTCLRESIYDWNVCPRFTAR